MKKNLNLILTILLALVLSISTMALAEEEPGFVEEYEVSALELGEQELPMGEDCTVAASPALDGEDDAEIMAASFETEGEVIPKGSGLPVLNITSQTLAKGDKLTLKVVRMDDGSSVPKLTWSSSKPKVASVDKSGKVTAKTVGTATITVKTKNGKKATCTVTVKKAPTKVTLNKTKATLTAGKTLTLTASIPSGTYTPKYTWSSSNKSVATVNAKGVVTGKKKGSAIITVKTENGKKATCKVTVNKNVIDLSMYLGKNIIEVARALGMEIDDYGASNSTVFLASYAKDAEKRSVDEINIYSRNTDYTIAGVTYGMTLSDADKILTKRGWKHTETNEFDNDLHQIFYQNSEGNEIDLYTYDSNNYTTIANVIIRKDKHDW